MATMRTRCTPLTASSHDTWWSSTSLAGLLKVLDKLRALPPADTPVSLNPTKHGDLVLVSHHYNWKPGRLYGRVCQRGNVSAEADRGR
ncbi:MAG: hypothetical protein WDM87_16135 [Terracidiphilus sp.]